MFRRRLFERLRTVPALGLVVLAFFSAADWPQWGGRDCRNMVSEERDLPESFTRGERGSGSRVDPATARNVKWAARLG